jgi:hypothetical protein
MEPGCKIMDVILAGKFESALVRSIDSILQPGRNISTNSYYIGLNRYVRKEYFERAGTFIALADNVFVPEVDWNFCYGKEYHGSLANTDLGISLCAPRLHEWDEETRTFARIILNNHGLTSESLNYISEIVLKEYSKEFREEFSLTGNEIEIVISEHYLCRLFLQLNSCALSKSFLVLSEDDIKLLQDICGFIRNTKIASPFELPDVEGRLIDPDLFCDGLLNFSPKDILSIGAVRADKEVRRYGKVISRLFVEAPSLDRERKVFQAMKEAHARSENGRRAEKLFETMSWIAKPFHYVPGLDATMTALEDAKDLGMKWLNRKVEDKEWYLIGVRMQEVAVEEYIRRKSNL